VVARRLHAARFYNPLTGQPVPVFARSLAACSARTRNSTRPIRIAGRNEALAAEFRWRRPAADSSLAAASSASASNRTAPDDPNYLSPTPTIPQNTTNHTGQAFCDDSPSTFRGRRGWAAGTTPVVWGIDFSVVFQSNRAPTAPGR
jgi:hypothetical protein